MIKNQGGPQQKVLRAVSLDKRTAVRQQTIQKVRKDLKRATRGSLCLATVSRVEDGQVFTNVHCITLATTDWSVEDLQTVRRQVCEHIDGEIAKRAGAVSTPAATLPPAASGVWAEEDTE